MAELKDGFLQFTIDEQRTQVANKMHYSLVMGLRGILGPQIADKQAWLAEANAVIAVLQAKIAEAREL